eukprot:scaffold2205_cov183-Ochromonas_danica.AAC.5
MVSIIPFSGGCYGYSRCSLGPAVGYFAGIAEMFKYILFAFLSAYYFGWIFLTVYDLEEKWLPLIWLGFFLWGNATVALGTKYLWWSWGLFALGTLSTQLMFVFGAIQEGHSSNLSIQNNPFDNTRTHFQKTLSYTAYLISGVDAVRTCANDRSDKIVPHAMIHVMLFTVCLSFAEVLALRAYVSNLSALWGDFFTYNVGLRLLFSHVRDKYFTFFSLAGSFGSTLGLLYGGARQMRSMAASGILPSFLSYTRCDMFRSLGYRYRTNANEQSKEDMVTDGECALDSCEERRPCAALLCCSLLTYSLLVAGQFTVEKVTSRVSHMCSLFATIEFFSLAAAYIAFSTRYSQMERGIRSPFGIFGALLVMSYFVLTFVSILRYQDDSKGLGLTLMITFVVSSIYYVLVARKRQFFSKEEQDKFMKAYVVNANRRRRMGSNLHNKSKVSLSRLFDRMNCTLSATSSNSMSRLSVLTKPVKNMRESWPKIVFSRSTSGSPTHRPKLLAFLGGRGKDNKIVPLADNNEVSYTLKTNPPGYTLEGLVFNAGYCMGGSK